MQIHDPKPFKNRLFEIKGIDRPLLEEGIYKAKFVTWRTFKYYDKCKVELCFEMLDPPLKGRRLGMFLEVASIGPGPSHEGEFTLKGKRSNFAKLIIRMEAFLGKGINMDAFSKLIWEIEVVTIKKGENRQDLLAEEQYSKILNAKPFLLTSEYDLRNLSWA